MPGYERNLMTEHWMLHFCVYLEHCIVCVCVCVCERERERDRDRDRDRETGRETERQRLRLNIAAHVVVIQRAKCKIVHTQPNE